MKIRSFAETDTLHIEFGTRDIVGTRDLDESTTIDVDAGGPLVAITLEHARPPHGRRPTDGRRDSSLSP